VATEDDPDVRQSLLLIHRSGLPLAGTVDLETPSYSLGRWREYDLSDFEAAEHLMLKPAETLGHAIRVDSKLLLDQRKLRKNGSFGHANHGVVVPDRIRRQLETISLTHIDFKPTQPAKYSGSAVHDQVLSWDHHGPPWWELWSDLVLPPVSPSMIKVDNKGNPVPRAYFQGAYMKDLPDYSDVELHYLRSEIEALDRFDLAVTYEESWGSLFTRPLIASQRFYQFCKEHKLKCDWVPVRIDEG